MKVLFHIRNAEWLGVETLMAVLRRKGHEVDLAFDCGAGDQDIRIPGIRRLLGVEKTLRHKVRTFRPDLIASCVLTNTWQAAKETYTLFREESRAPIVVGGPHATAAPDAILSHSAVHAVCIGEGEDALEEFCSRLERGESCDHVRNFRIRREGKIIDNPLRPLLSNLDDLPFPFKDPFFERGAFLHRSYVMTGRGCPFRCRFCSSGHYQQIYGNPPGYVRRHSVQWVIEMCREEIRRFPIREFFFYDETFILNEGWAEHFAQRYGEEIGLPFKVLLRPGTFQRKTLKELKTAGLLYVDVGVEAGNERIRTEVLGKKISNAAVLESCRMLQEEGIGLTLLLMVGCPEETPDNMRETYETVLSVRPDGVVMHTFYPFLGTPAWDMAREAGWIRENNERALREGIGSYRDAATLLNNPHREAAKRWFLLLPICTKLPLWTHRFVLRLPGVLPVRILSSFCTSIPRNLRIRLQEFLWMLYKQWRLSLQVRSTEKRSLRR